MTQIKFEFEDLNSDHPPDTNVWHDLYLKAFPHPDEQEPWEAFRQVLQMNGDPDVQARFGPYHYSTIAIRDSATRRIVGGLAFSVTTSKAHVAAGFAASVQIIFLFTDYGVRGHLLTKRETLLAVIQQRALTAFPSFETHGASKIAIFFEANNPLD